MFSHTFKLVAKYGEDRMKMFLQRKIRKFGCRACMQGTFVFFTARCTIVQSAVLRSHVVCPSVRLSVMFVDCDHIG